MTVNELRRNDAATRRDVLRTLGAAGAAVAGTASASALRASAAQATDATSITLLHDTHLHGRLGEPGEAENAEHYFGLMDELAADAEHVLRLGAGDELASSALSTEFQGEQVVEVFDAAGLDYCPFGNHDFDYGPDVLRQRVAESDEFVWVSANAVDERTGDVFAAEEGAQRYDVATYGDVTVGVTGLLPTRAREVTQLGPHVRVLDPAEALREVVPEMRAEGADVVIVCAHLANQIARELVQDVDGVDVLVGDDAAEVLGASEVGGAVLSFVGDGYDYLGEIELQVGADGVDGYDYELYETAAAVDRLDVEPNPDVQAVAEEYRSQVDSEPIGRSDVQLNAVTEDLRTGETNLGNFVADALRERFDADATIQNGGGIRTGTRYPAGELTDLLVNQLLPFGNESLLLRVDGATIVEAIEHGLAEVETLHGRFPQVSGVAYEWNPEAPPGDRVVSVTVDGEPIDPDATYEIATNDFLAGGGDGYEMFADAPVVETGPALAEVVQDRVERRTPISPAVEGRITRTAGPTVAIDSVAVESGGTDSVDLSLVSAGEDGFSGGRLVVSVADTEVATITDVEHGDAFELARTSAASPDADAVELAVVDLEDEVAPDATDVSLATIELRGTGAGVSALTVEAEAFDGESGSSVDVATQDGRVVTGPPSLPDTRSPPTDPDGDGVYEDANGNGRLDYDDVVQLFENLESDAVGEHADAYDVNGNDRLDYQDVVALYDRL